MIFVSIAEAAELTGKSIPTLYQHIQEGKLSGSHEKINTKDLIQLYGALKRSDDYRRENEFLHNLTTHLKLDKERLYQINDLLRKSNADLKQEKDKLYRIIMSLQKLPVVEIAPIKPEVLVKSMALDQPVEIVKLMEIEKESLTRRLFRKLFCK